MIGILTQSLRNFQKKKKIKWNQTISQRCCIIFESPEQANSLRATCWPVQLSVQSNVDNWGMTKQHSPAPASKTSPPTFSIHEEIEEVGEGETAEVLSDRGQVVVGGDNHVFGVPQNVNNLHPLLLESASGWVLARQVGDEYTLRTTRELRRLEVLEVDEEAFHDLILELGLVLQHHVDHLPQPVVAWKRYDVTITDIIVISISIKYH